MVRVKFVQNYKNYKKGEIESLSPNEAFGLIDAGKAVISKDMVAADQSMAKDHIVAEAGTVKPKARDAIYDIKEK